MISRRTAIAAGLASCVAAPALCADEKPTLVYVSAGDCPDCIIWARDYEPQFLASAEYKKLIFRQVKSPTIRQTFKDVDLWPEDLRWIRDVFWKKNWLWVPAFALVRDHKFLVTGGGTENQYSWAARVWPAIQKELAKS